MRNTACEYSTYLSLTLVYHSWMDGLIDLTLFLHFLGGMIVRCKPLPIMKVPTQRKVIKSKHDKNNYHVVQEETRERGNVYDVHDYHLSK